MKKVVFFPYHPDISILIDHRDALKDWEIGGILSFKEDEALIDALNRALGLETLPYDRLLHGCGAVILLDNYRGYRNDKYYQVVEDAIGFQKEIFVTPEAWAQLDLGRYENKIQLLERLPEDIDAIDTEYKLRLGTTDNRLYPIKVPVIGVFGQGKSCDKFETQLLFKQVLDRGYKVAVVSSNALGVLFGCYSMPSFLYENISFQEKIIKFNYFIRKISRIGESDAVVIGVPEGVAPFRRQEFHHFAEYPLVISSAVDFDLVVLCTYFFSGNILESGLKSFIDFCQNKFDVPIDAVAISRTITEVPYGDDETIIRERLGEDYLRRHYPDVKSINLPMISLLDREDAMASIERVLERLQENVVAL